MEVALLGAAAAAATMQTFIPVGVGVGVSAAGVLLKRWWDKNFAREHEHGNKQPPPVFVREAIAALQRYRRESQPDVTIYYAAGPR